MTCDSLDGRVACEVVVIGAGITGALVSDMLIRAGIDTVLVDQGAVGAGSTAASTGLLLYEVDVRLVELIQQVGEAQAVHAYRRGLQAIAEIEQLASELGDQCAFVSRNALYLASEQRHLTALQQEHECRQYYGFDVTFLNAAGLNDLCGLQGHGALFSRGDADVNPYVLTQSFVRRAQQNGLRAFAETLRSIRRGRLSGRDNNAVRAHRGPARGIRHRLRGTSRVVSVCGRSADFVRRHQSASSAGAMLAG